MSDRQETRGQTEPDLVLSVRGANLVRRVGAATVGDLVHLTAEELLSARCFGETSLKEIQEALSRRGLALGMTPAQLRGRRGLQARIVARGQADTRGLTADEEACCEDCKVSAEQLHERAGRERKLNMSLAELELSVRATNCLESEGITTVRDLVIRADEELLEIRQFSEAMLREVQARLEQRGLRLGMKLEVR